ncbi:zinc finger protein zas1 [Echria macrotheca]|uniref:Zinc finger protein zas1 n=1 Tax=Echria macrotheca TaxID=438768 RepID=A0AAJ0F4Z1_9PEZI|nr:zinc finger protein zas1 [Echria macrotheca]
MSTMFGDPFPPCSADERVEWILVPVPVRVPVSESSTPISAHAQTLFPTYPPSGSPDFAYHATWNQQHAGPAFPAMSPAEDVLGDAQFAFDLALLMDTAIFPEPSPLPAAHPTAETAFVPPPAFFPELMPGSSPSAVLSTDGAFAGDIWPTNSPSASDSSFGSPVPGMSSTPNSTPPTPALELFFCSEPTCFETFSTTASLKRHERKHRRHFCCPLCKKSHLDKRALDRHLWSRHEEYAARVGAKSEKTACRVCGYESRADNVRRHERSRHGVVGGGDNTATRR